MLLTGTITFIVAIGAVPDPITFPHKGNAGAVAT